MSAIVIVWAALAQLSQLAEGPAVQPAAPKSSGAASATSVEIPTQPQALRTAVHEALKREANAAASEHAPSVRHLVALFQVLERGQQFSREEQLQLRSLVRNRLLRVSQKLQRPASRGQQSTSEIATIVNGVVAPAEKPAAVAPPAAQQFAPLPNAGPGGANNGGLFGGQARDHGQELVELIEDTIAPESWDSRGGPGTIRYYSPLKVIVVRQTGEVHDGLSGLVEQLRK